MTKKLSFFLLATLISLPLSSQNLRLTAEDNAYTAGDVIIKQQVEYKDAGISGHGVVWDFAFLQPITRNNCIYKCLPGCDPVYYVYDRADRIVFSQDGIQRAGNRWTYTRYDNFGRILYTGICKTVLNHSTLQNNFKDLLVIESRTNYNFGYTQTAYSSIIYIDLLSVNYYDNYLFLNLYDNDTKTALTYTENPDYDKPYVSSPTVGDLGGFNAKTLLTGTRTYILDDSGNFLTTAFYYDSKARIVQQRSTNHLNGFDIVYNKYNFTGTVAQTLKEHSISPLEGSSPPSGDLGGVEYYAYTYDHAERLISTTYTLNDNAPIVLSKNSYDNLGRLIGKNRHSKADTESFAYNIRNWTTQIKSGNSFEENIFYNNAPNPVIPYFNGNISATSIKTNANDLSAYVYEYDGLNRLTSASTSIPDFNTMPINNNFSEFFSYDKHGNITSLTRTGKQPKLIFGFGNAEPISKLMDNLEMEYNGNQLTKVTDFAGNSNTYNIKEYADKADLDIEMTYDKNGNLIKDLDREILSIQYNILNLPRQVNFSDGSVILNIYAADGRKLSSYYVTEITQILLPVARGVLNEINIDDTGIVDIMTQLINLSDIVEAEGTHYIDNYEYLFDIHENAEYMTDSRIHNSEGYSSPLEGDLGGFDYYYYRKDHLGNNREVWKANTNEVVQTTNYYPSGLPWAYTTDQVQPYMHNGTEFIEMFGYDVSDHGNRGDYNATNRYTTMDRFAEKKPWQSPYVHADNNMIRYIDVMGDSAWQITNQWTKDYMIGYSNYVASQTQKYINEGQEFTCEDFALSLLIDYASENGLPVTIENGKDTYDARSDSYSDVETFKNDVLTTTGARDLQNSENTITLSDLSTAKGGDIIINRNQNNVGTHIQVVTSKSSNTDFGQTTNFLDIAQGNSGVLNKIPYSSAILKAGNPNSSFYTGKPIERAVLTLNTNTYWNRATGRTYENYSKVKNIDVRRWNFLNF